MVSGLKDDPKANHVVTDFAFRSYNHILITPEP